MGSRAAPRKHNSTGDEMLQIATVHRCRINLFMAERLRRAYPTLLEWAGVFEMKLSPLFMAI
jgi:hypothetical protein